MKKATLFFSTFMLLSIISFAQVKDSDIQLFQQYFGVEKTALVKEYMNLTPAEDSLFWKDYNAYETSRLDLGKRRIKLVDQYFTSIQDLDATKADEMVKEVNSINLEFTKLQLKYYKKMSKTIGSVKAAQFYQMESYINNVINLGIQENIPFVGDLEQKHDRKK